VPINTTHPSYAANIDKWERCRDVYNGDDAIKARGQKYLPKIDAGQSSAEYKAYAGRATFFEAVGRTVDGFIGAISRRPAKVTLPDRMRAMIYDSTTSGVALSEMIRQLSLEILAIGRCGILVDYDERLRRSFLKLYQTEQITNWSDERIVLHELICEPDPVDPYKLTEVEQYRELTLAGGVYSVVLWRKVKNEYGSDAEWAPYGEPIVPTKRGQAFDKIPFCWVSILGSTAEICKPPLLGMVNVSLSHYRLSADYAHGLHWSALPTFYITGYKSDEPVTLGAATALLIENENARVGFAEYKSDGLGSLERAIAAKEKQMAELGASLISEASRAETAEAVRIKHSGATGLLQSAVTAVQESLQAALQVAAEWEGASGSVSLEINDDFISARLDPQTLLGLVSAYQAGALTLGSLLQAMQDGDLLPMKTIVTDEVANLKAREGNNNAA
jgi:hypothetical protein